MARIFQPENQLDFHLLIGWFILSRSIMCALERQLNPFPELFGMPPGGVSTKAKDALLKKRLTDRQVAVSYVTLRLLIGRQMRRQQRQELLYLKLAGELRHPARERAPPWVALLELGRACLQGQDIAVRCQLAQHGQLMRRWH
jgi:hypothetical protein